MEEFVLEHLEIGATKAGRDVSQIQICAEAVCSVSNDRELAMSGVRGRDRKERVDAVAACAILQAWMDARRT